MHGALDVLRKWINEPTSGHWELGSGYYSSVYEIDNGYVAKVCHRGWDDGWVAWAAWCMRYKPKHGPKIYAFYLSRGRCIAIMKKYDVIVQDGWDGPWKLKDTGRVVAKVGDKDVLEMKSWLNNKDNTTEMGKMAYAFSRDFGLFDDVQARNCMWDPDLDCIIATDPYCSSPSDWQWKKVAALLDGLDNVIVGIDDPQEEEYYRGSRLECLRRYESRAEGTNAMLRVGHDGNRIQDPWRDKGALLQMRGEPVARNADKPFRRPVHDCVIVDDVADWDPNLLPRVFLAGRDDKAVAARGEAVAGREVDQPGAKREAMLRMVDWAQKIDPAMLRARLNFGAFNVGVLAGPRPGAMAKAEVSDEGSGTSEQRNVQQRKKRHHPVDPGWTHNPRGGHHKRGACGARVP